ncbi:50S ribosomal protein L21, chloroplastic [Hondaea fermentalgiana]|uniref:Large ribosomal subunit protein bL21m n=1 Tax=Hondaea fermentalgiana TaxID=2315210 RepID=A0A2R5G4I2_9STRA|nr:50S ribosomal protein L21, chloroplastic [Hondaea fermentalgiana]|eukprot:GBG25932.1 50S ribosomal protein L21, chloroplastic [Hondaea fermentalgiana]
MDPTRLLDMAQRTGVSDKDLEEFERKANETAALIKGLKEGTLAPEEVRVPGEKTEEELRAEEEARQKREEEKRQRAEARKLQERTEWWERAEVLRGASRVSFLETRRAELRALVKGNDSIVARKHSADSQAQQTITDDDGNVLFPRPKEKTDALDYSKWDRWIPDDPVSLEEMQRAKDEIEEQRNQQFEAMNPEFCSQFKEDQAKRNAARQRKDKEAETLRQRGNTRFKQGRLDDALIEYGKALKLVPWSLPVLCNLAQTHLRRGAIRLEEAVQDLTYASLLRPSDEEIRRALSESRQDLLELYAEKTMRAKEQEENAASEALSRELERLMAQTEPNVRVLKQMCSEIASIDAEQDSLSPVAKLALDGVLECATEAKSESTQAEVHVLLRQTGALETLFRLAASARVRDSRPYRLLACSVARSKANRDIMTHAGVLDAVLTSAAESKHAICVLHAFSEYAVFQEMLARRHEVALCIKTAIVSPESRAFSPAALCLANLASTKESRERLGKESIIAEIGNDLCAALQADRAAREDAAAALANMCQDANFVSVVLVSDAGHGIFKVALDTEYNHHTPATVAFLLAAMLNMTVDPASPMRDLLTPSRCETLAGWTFDPDMPNVTRTRCAALLSRALTAGPQREACLTRISCGPAAVRTLPGLTELVMTEGIDEHAVRIVAALLQGAQAPSLKTRGLIENLARLLREQALAAERSGTVRVQLSANLGQCFVQLSGDSSFCQQLVVREKIIPSLVKLLQFCEQKSVRKNVAISLAKLAKSTSDNLASIPCFKFREVGLKVVEPAQEPLGPKLGLEGFELARLFYLKLDMFHAHLKFVQACLPSIQALSSLSGGDAGEAPAAAKALPEWKARVISKTREAVAARRAAEEARIAESRTSVVEHPVVLPFRDPAAPSKFAVVALSGTQYKVVEDDLIVCNLIEGAEVGKEYVIDEVLLVGGLDKTVIGRPVIKGATVTAVVEEITRDKKILIMKRRTKNHKSRRTKGFRRDVTFLRISSIDYDLKQI